VPGRKRGRPPITSYTPQELQELQQRKEAKRHHEATWHERNAARDAARARARAEKAAAREEDRRAALDAKLAKQAAAREEWDKQAAARKAARWKQQCLKWDKELAREVERVAAKEARTAAKEARAAAKAAQQAKEMEAEQADKEYWNQLWNSASAQPSESGLPTCAFCHRWIIEGRPDPADCLSTGECVWYCNFCWTAWEHRWKDLTAQQRVALQERILARLHTRK